MRRLLILGLLPCLLAAEDHWVKFTSGPFEVLTDAGPRAGRETMVRFQEFRHALGQLVGEQDLQTPQPVRILVFKNAKGWTSPAPVAEGRDRYAIVLQEKGAVTPAVYRELTRIFLKANTAQMPPAFEHGLVEFLSTFEVNGIRITVGTPPGAAGAPPDLDWARVHMLVVQPEYFGKLRVLLYNLRKGVDEDPAFRNAFGKGRAEIEAQAKLYLAAGNFQTTSLSSRPMTEADFPEKQISEADVRLARADLLAGSQSAADYESLLRDHVKVAEAEEGLGLLALGDHRNDEARRHFAAATEAGSSSARCFIEYAKLEPDDEKATQALLRAAGINSRLEEPFVLMARRDTDPRKRLAHWKAATERNPRNPSYWQALADCYLADHNYAEAAKAWKAGEQSATDPAERQRMHQARMSIEQQRLDFEEAEKRHQAEEDARELEKLKAQARAEVRALEAKANAGAPQSDSKAIPWWEGPAPSGKLRGNLKQVDCLGKQARLLVEGEDRKIVRLLVTDPGQIAISGGGEQSLGCGVQKPRRVAIEYFPKANARLATVGEVATIEFQ
jgi:hypothetical protein